MEIPPFRYKTIFLHAEGFYRAASICFNVGQSEEQTDFTPHLFNAAFTNHAFACEIYLKCLYVLEKNKYYKGKSHSLIDLFGELKPETQERITSIYNANSTNHPERLQERRNLGDDSHYTLECILKQSAAAYYIFRYSYEPNREIHYKIWNVVEALRCYIAEIKPEWELSLPLNFKY